MSLWDDHMRALDTESIALAMEEWSEAVNTMESIPCCSCGKMGPWAILHSVFLQRMGKTSNAVILGCHSCGGITTIEQARCLHIMDQQLAEAMEGEACQ